jgi:hypothetical protein
MCEVFILAGGDLLEDRRPPHATPTVHRPTG